MKCLSHHIVSRVYAVYMTFSVDTDLDQLAKVVFVCFLHWKVTLYVSPVQQCTFWKKVTMGSPHQGSEELCSTTFLRRE